MIRELKKPYKPLLTKDDKITVQMEDGGIRRYVAIATDIGTEGQKSLPISIGYDYNYRESFNKILKMVRKALEAASSLIYSDEENPSAHISVPLYQVPLLIRYAVEGYKRRDDPDEILMSLFLAGAYHSLDFVYDDNSWDNDKKRREIERVLKEYGIGDDPTLEEIMEASQTVIRKTGLNAVYSNLAYAHEYPAPMRVGHQVYEREHTRQSGADQHSEA